MTETYSRADMGRAIEAAFRMGFSNALDENTRTHRVWREAKEAAQPAAPTPAAACR